MKSTHPIKFLINRNVYQQTRCDYRCRGRHEKHQIVVPNERAQDRGQNGTHPNDNMDVDEDEDEDEGERYEEAEKG